MVVDGGPGVERVLLVRRSDTGRWSVPAGIVEPDEQPADCIVREIREETTVLARAERLALLVADPELSYPNGDRCQFISMTFRCGYVSGRPTVGDEESTDVGWFAVDALPDGLTSRALRRIRAALSPNGPCEFDQSVSATG